MKRTLCAMSIIAFLTSFAAAQNLDRDCNPVGVPASCQDEKRAVEAIETRLDQVQRQLQGASPARKPALLRRIEGINAELATAKAALNRCIRENVPRGPDMQLDEIDARVTGVAVLETSSKDSPGPHIVEFDIGIRFSRNRCRVVVTRFPRIRIDAGAVNVDVTQNKAGTGTYHPVTRRMSISLDLHFHYRTVLITDDDATFPLNTEDSITRINGAVVTGAVLDSNGNLRLVGSGRFLHGYLAGATGRMFINATVLPHP